MRKLDPAHIREVASSIRVLGFCDPILVGRDNEIISGEARYLAALQLGLDTIPCILIGHLNAEEQRVLRLAVNRLAEKGEWTLDGLKIEFEELLVIGAPIEITGFSLPEIDLIILGDGAGGLESGPLEPEPKSAATSKPGDMFQLGPHRVICGNAVDPETLRRLMDGDELARLVYTDEPYNVRIAGNVSGGAHREFAMASGEMTDAEFLDFNSRWMRAALAHLLFAVS